MHNTDESRLNEAWMDASNALDMLKECDQDALPFVKRIIQKLEPIVDEIWAEYSSI